MRMARGERNETYDARRGSETIDFERGMVTQVSNGGGLVATIQPLSET